MYSQASQDDFVDMVLEGQTKGYYVDVGGACDDHTQGSNSLMFEQRGWNGLVVDNDPHRMVGRKCSFANTFIGDGSNNTKKLGDILKENNVPELVDYLSIDIEGQDFNALKSFIESGYSFKVATIEHNLYSRNPGVDQLKADIFNILAANGYVRVVDNAGDKATLKNLHAGWAFEDWYINPKYVNYQKTISKIRSSREVLI